MWRQHRGIQANERRLVGYGGDGCFLHARRRETGSRAVNYHMPRDGFLLPALSLIFLRG